MVTQGVFGHYDIHCGRSMTQVVHWVCGLEGTPAGEVRRAAELAMAGKMAGEVAGAAVREMAGDGGKEVLAAVLARGGERWVMEGVGYDAGGGAVCAGGGEDGGREGDGGGGAAGAGRVSGRVGGSVV